MPRAACPTRWVALIFAAAAGSCSDPPSAATNSVAAAPPANDPVTVVRVIDGDIFATLLDSGERLIGVNAPEDGECLVEEAQKRPGELLEGEPLRLETDQGQSDRFRRMKEWLASEGLGGDTLGCSIVQ